MAGEGHRSARSATRSIASRLNNLTLGLDRYARRNMHRLPVAIMRLRAIRRRTAQFFGTYDAVLTPTVADETPRLGYFDPTADAQQIMDQGSTGTRSRRCRTSPASPLSHCRWPNPRAVCQSA